MLTKSNLRINKRNNKIISHVREVYLRKDIYCGSAYCVDCYDTKNLSSTHEGNTPVLSKDKYRGPTLEDIDGHTLVQKSHYLIFDTTAIIKQMDVLLNPKLNNIIILQTVMNDLKEKNIRTYYKFRDLMKDTERTFLNFYNDFSE